LVIHIDHHQVEETEVQGKKLPQERPRLHRQSAKNTLDIIPEIGVIKTLLLNVPMPSDPVLEVVIKEMSNLLQHITTYLQQWNLRPRFEIDSEREGHRYTF